MISGSVQRDIGKKLANLVLHKYLYRSDLQPINSLLGGFITTWKRRVIPSCVLWCIRSVYEERDGVYVNYQEEGRD